MYYIRQNNLIHFHSQRAYCVLISRTCSVWWRKCVGRSGDREKTKRKC